jgi:ornithine carbamoyltransferase
MRHLLTLADLTPGEIERIFSIAEDLKSKFLKGLREPLLPGRVMALLFEKQSLRTRVSFEAGMAHLGGSAMFLGGDVGFGRREPMADFGQVLSKYVDVIVVRANRHETVAELAEHCTCSVINGLTDFAHPCQAMADLYTLRELCGSLEGRTLAWVGDANNVARSLSMGCGKIGMKMVMATPEGYRFDERTLAWFRREVPNLDLTVTADPVEAVRGATAVYTDVWASMGQESEAEERKRDLRACQVNAELMSHTQKGAVFMHCLPAHRGEEVTDEVIDGPQSVVVEQAGNRMHVQKGVLAWLLGRKA